MKTAKETVLKKDVAKVSAALRRAAKQARKKAVQTRTPLVIYEDGRIKRKMVIEG
jgi:Ribonuclease G/E